MFKKLQRKTFLKVKMPHVKSLQLLKLVLGPTVTQDWVNDYQRLEQGRRPMVASFQDFKDVSYLTFSPSDRMRLWLTDDPDLRESYREVAKSDTRWRAPRRLRQAASVVASYAGQFKGRFWGGVATVAALTGAVVLTAVLAVVFPFVPYGLIGAVGVLAVTVSVIYGGYLGYHGYQHREEIGARSHREKRDKFIKSAASVLHFETPLWGSLGEEERKRQVRVWLDSRGFVGGDTLLEDIIEKVNQKSEKSIEDSEEKDRGRSKR